MANTQHPPIGTHAFDLWLAQLTQQNDNDIKRLWVRLPTQPWQVGHPPADPDFDPQDTSA